MRQELILTLARERESCLDTPMNESRSTTTFAVSAPGFAPWTFTARYSGELAARQYYAEVHRVPVESVTVERESS